LSGPVLIVIPAWGEAANLPAVVGELRAERPADDILVVDDGSTDGTAQAARQLGCRLVRLPFHLGYGAGLQAGVKYGMRRGYSAVVSFDGDGQHDPRDIQGLLEALEQGADLALGSRVLAADAHGGGVARRLGRALFAGLARRLTGLSVSDPTSGLKALSPAAQRLFALARFPDRFPDADALVLLARARLRLAERPACMRPSRNRRSMHGGLRGVAYTFNMLFSLLVAALGHEADLKE
jgi:glycosyltransferase involved in cell wall biosynthesis